MRLIDLIWNAAHCHPVDAAVEVRDLDGNRYRALDCGMKTEMHVIGGSTEEVFVVRVQLVRRAEREQ